MTSAQTQDSFSNRVRGPPSVNVDRLECSICHDLLWKPVACQACETPFCSACINRWLVDNRTKCPNRCKTYIERKCPPFVAKLLAELQISCSYQSNDCNQVIPYEALDKHEVNCGYQPQLCLAFQTQILKKDFDSHKSSCALIALTCEECKIVYKRSDGDVKHTESICMKAQLRQLRNESKENKQELQKLISWRNKMCILNPEFNKVTIKFDDLPCAVQVDKAVPNRYRRLNWTGIWYKHKLYADKQHPRSGYVTSFIPGGSPHIAYFSPAASINVEIPNETITLVSVTACAAWNDDLQLTITGHQKSTEVNTHTSTLRFGQPQLILLQWKNIDKIIFESSGGKAHPGSDKASGLHVIFTDLTICFADSNNTG